MTKPILTKKRAILALVAILVVAGVGLGVLSPDRGRPPADAAVPPVESPSTPTAASEPSAGSVPENATGGGDVGAETPTPTPERDDDLPTASRDGDEKRNQKKDATGSDDPNGSVNATGDAAATGRDDGPEDHVVGHGTQTEARGERDRNPTAESEQVEGVQRVQRLLDPPAP
jgi:hypothetical protein